MSIYKNIRSLKEGEMFLSEDSKTLQIVKDGKLSIVDPTSLVIDIDKIDKFKMSWKLPNLFNPTITDTVNNILYMWEREKRVWISFVLEMSKNPGISLYVGDLNSLYPGTGIVYDKFGNISLDFETAGL